MCILSKPISALQLVTDNTGRIRERRLTQLPSKSAVEICGDGFNTRTIQVRSGENTYFIFRDDLPLRDAILASPARFG